MQLTAPGWKNARNTTRRSLRVFTCNGAGLIETLFAWWTDVLRASNGVAQRDLADAKKETAALASRFNTAEILKRIRALEELRDHLGRNIQEAIAIEVTFLTIFTA